MNPSLFRLSTFETGQFADFREIVCFVADGNYSVHNQNAPAFRSGRYLSDFYAPILLSIFFSIVRKNGLSRAQSFIVQTIVGYTMVE